MAAKVDKLIIPESVNPSCGYVSIHYGILQPPLRQSSSVTKCLIGRYWSWSYPATYPIDTEQQHHGRMADAELVLL